LFQFGTIIPYMRMGIASAKQWSWGPRVAAHLRTLWKKSFWKLLPSRRKT